MDSSSDDGDGDGSFDVNEGGDCSFDVDKDEDVELCGPDPLNNGFGVPLIVSTQIL